MLTMKVCTLLLIDVLQLLNCKMAKWDIYSPLVLVDIPPKIKEFPPVVRLDKKFECKIYYDVSQKAKVNTHFYCPDLNAENPKCNYVESFTHADYESGKCLNKKCSLPVQYDMIRVTDSLGENESCNYFGKTGQLYEFVYWRCEHGKDEKEATPIYKVCYHDDKKRIILGSYKIDNASLLKYYVLEDEQEYLFNFSIWPSLEENPNPFLTVAHKLYSQPTKYKPRSVLPHEWHPYGHQRRPLFHYTNVAPMDEVLIVGWEMLMRNLRNRIASLDLILNVTAGLIDFTEGEPGYGQFLGYVDNESFIAIPGIWWILIHTNNYSHGIVIMMHNQPLEIIEGNQNMSYYDKNCSHDVCIQANLHESFPDRSMFCLNFIYCCRPNVIAGRLQLKRINEILVFRNQSRHASLRLKRKRKEQETEFR